MKQLPAVSLAGLAVFFSSVSSSCSDDGVGEVFVASQFSEEARGFWETGLRSAAQQEVMLKSHGVGFSYDAIFGKNCDIGSVRCQVLDLDALAEDNIYYRFNAPSVSEHGVVSHSVAEYFQNTNIDFEVSADATIFSGDYKKVMALFEHGTQDAVLVENKRVAKVARKVVDTEDYQNYLSELEGDERSKYLSESFKYALARMAAAGYSDAVVDSFIHIFGSHVVVEAAIGGSVELSVKTTSSTIKTYELEKQMTDMSLDAFLFELESKTEEETQKGIVSVLKNSELSFKATGGNTSSFAALIANPSSLELATNREMYNQWASGLNYDASEPWNSMCELVDMKIEPIWSFIPDNEAALHVMARIKATVPTMQELYGNRNFIDVSFPTEVSSVTCRMGNETKTFKSPWVVDIEAAGRRVATLCREWVPELDANSTVTVAYPIYENHVDLKSGVCIHGDVAYNVRWLYDRFVVDTLRELPGGSASFYLHSGFIDVVPASSAVYQDGRPLIGYEWPGSIGIDGSLQDKPYYETRKFLGEFYLNTGEELQNLPNWIYVNESQVVDYYEKRLKESDAGYELSGVALSGRSGDGVTAKRMVRSRDYTYVINTSEIGYISHTAK